MLLLVVAIVLTGAGPAPAAWTLPVDGPVVGRFAVGVDRFAAGQRRGVDLAAPPGARVVAPCGGRVAFAGSLPRFGLGVSLRCGRLTATVLGLGGEVPRVGAAVGRGDPIGRVGPGGRVRLGARVTRLRFGYRDPLTLMGADPAPRAPLVGPRGGARRPAPPAAAAAPGRAPAPAPAPAHASAPRDAAPPTLAWIGLALIASALPGGAIAWRIRRSRAPLARPHPSRPR